MRGEQINGPRAIAFLEQYWGTDLSAHDPDGPLPDIEPSEAELDPSRGTIPIGHRTGKTALIRKWRESATERGLSIRQLVLEVTPGHPAFVGTPSDVADDPARTPGPASAHRGTGRLSERSRSGRAPCRQPLSAGAGAVRSRKPASYLRRR
ncbi:hypothetical protein [Streptomyces sp. NPDC001833]|uniref:hypothetical protein n=1 Tax=Streptomyces sp. NPDC001833 TaxID=3154658 RepID=UPI00332065D2